MSDTQDAPLIQREREDDSRSGAEAGKVAEGRPSLFVWMLVVSAGISGLLFGCESCPPPPLVLHPHLKKLTY